MTAAGDLRFPKKYLSAGAVVRHSGRLLLVNPTYKPQWEIPGGIVEDGESPHGACVREVREELGIDLPVGRLLALDYRQNARFGEGLHFIFDGGELSAADLDRIDLPAEELSEHRLATADEAATLLVPSVWRRVARALDALESGETLYLEDGERRP